MNEYKAIPNLYEGKEYCCGCAACFSVCPFEAIEMNADEEGFLYPVINENKCIRCSKCIKVCAFKRDQSLKGFYQPIAQEEKVKDTIMKINPHGYSAPEVYAVKHKSDEERMASQSGGMFAILSDLIMSEDGVVYGCAFDENFNAVHVRAENRKDRDRMRYSKYVQSSIGNVFIDTLNDLKTGKLVLFSGTSCQIAGLYSFLQTSTAKDFFENLFTVDIVCHGVPSPLVWNDYLKWECNRKHSSLKDVVCRNKRKYGWKSHVVSIDFMNGRKTDSKVFPKLFYGHNILRPSCYQCPYKAIIHPADITIADYWGIEKASPGFKDDKGVSLVLVNNQHGYNLFERCKQYFIYKETKIEDSMQQPLIGPYAPPQDREKFWRDYTKLSFDEIAKKYGDWGMIKDLKWKVKATIKRKLRRHL